MNKNNQLGRLGKCKECPSFEKNRCVFFKKYLKESSENLISQIDEVLDSTNPKVKEYKLSISEFKEYYDFFKKGEKENGVDLDKEDLTVLISSYINSLDISIEYQKNFNPKDEDFKERDEKFAGFEATAICVFQQQ